MMSRECLTFQQWDYVLCIVNHLECTTLIHAHIKLIHCQIFVWLLNSHELFKLWRNGIILIIVTISYQSYQGLQEKRIKQESEGD